MRGVIDEHYGAVVAYFLRRFFDQRRAEILAEEVFEMAWTRADQMPAEPGVKRWLLQMAYMKSSTSERARGEVLTQDDLAERLLSASSNSVLEQISKEEVLAFFDLRPVEQEALRLVCWEGLSSPEAALVLGCSPETLSQRLYRAACVLATAHLDHCRSRIVEDSEGRWRQGELPEESTGYIVHRTEMFESL